MRERVLKAIADRDRRSSGSHVEGGEGTSLVAHEGASVQDEVHREESSQDAKGPSSTNVVANIGTQVQRPRYFLLLEIDGFLMWQWFGQSGPLKDHLGLTVKAKLNYFLRPGLKEFLKFCLNNFEVMFWTTAEDRTLEPQYEELLKVCPTLGENRPRFGRHWCDQSTYINPITKKQDCYLKRLNRLLTDRRCLAEYCHLKDYFLILDLLSYRNVLNNPYSAYHPTMYHRQSKSDEFDAEIPYFRSAVQPFLQRLLDSRKTVPQYCAENNRCGWRRLLLVDEKHTLYRHVFPDSAQGFEVDALAMPWSIPTPRMN